MLNLYLEKSDFWPPVQGGWEVLRGFVTSIEPIIHALGAELGTQLEQHPDYIDSEDDDLLSFLDERAQDAKWPAPVRVFSVGEHRRSIRGLPPEWGPGIYVLWTENAVASSRTLQQLLAENHADGPLEFRIKYGRFVPAGADLLLWLGIFFVVIWLFQYFCP